MSLGLWEPNYLLKEYAKANRFFIVKEEYLFCREFMPIREISIWEIDFRNDMKTKCDKILDEFVKELEQFSKQVIRSFNN